MHIILSGTRRVGKSTVCNKIADALSAKGHSVGGVWTETLVEGDERILMAHDLLTGEVTTLASTKDELDGPVQGPFTFAKAGLFQAMRAIGAGMKSDLLVVDEIGPLELAGKGFYPMLHVIGRARHTLLVIRQGLLDDALTSLRLGHAFDVKPVDQENRDELADELTAQYLDAIARDHA